MASLAPIIEARPAPMLVVGMGASPFINSALAVLISRQLPATIKIKGNKFLNVIEGTPDVDRLRICFEHIAVESGRSLQDAFMIGNKYIIFFPYVYC